MNTETDKKPASAQSDLTDGFAVMLEKMERAAFEKWYAENAFNFERDPIGSRDCGLQWAAWKARAAHNKPCRGIAHHGCNYLAACGSICNKCGQAV